MAHTASTTRQRPRTSFRTHSSYKFQEFFSAMASCATDFTDAFQSLVVYRDSRNTLGEESATESLLDSLTKVSATKEEWSNLIKKKMSISRIRMRPQQVMYFAQIIKSDPTKLLVCSKYFLYLEIIFKI